MSEELYINLVAAIKKIDEQYMLPTGYPIDYSDNTEKFHLKHRYNDVYTVKQPEFQNYPAAKIQDGYVIAEGPKENTLSDLLNDLKVNQIDTLVAVGKSSEEGREKFYNYMANSTEIALKEFFAKATSLSEPPKELLDQTKKTNFKFYCYSSEDHGNFYIMHIPNWDDHGMPRLTKSDKIVLGYFAESGKSSCYHCSAGVGRSVAVMIIMMFYRDLFKVQDNLTIKDIENYFEKVFKLIKEVKPNAGEEAQLLTVPGIAEDIYDLMKYKLKHQENYDPRMLRRPIPNKQDEKTDSNLPLLQYRRQEESPRCCSCTLI